MSLTPHELRRVAVLAGVDPRTVRNVIDGKPTRSTCLARVREALQRFEAEQGEQGSKPAARRTG